MKKYTLIILIALSIILSLSAYTRADRLTVVASVFPLFDFAREVAGTDADVRMLLPAGVEPHSWEPNPSDMVAVSRSDIFLYVSEEMEPWAHKMVTAVGGKDILFVEIMDKLGVPATKYSHAHPEHDEGHTGIDPHFWLDLSMSAQAVKIIGGIFTIKDPVHGNGYSSRAHAYARRLEDIDLTYSKTLENCRTRKFVTGGHSAFGHFARRYGLVQISLYGISPDSEPTPSHLATVSRTMMMSSLDVVFFEEMVNPRLAMVLASETGARTLVLSPAGNLTAERMNRGVSFIQVMEENLENLRKGLYCE